MSEEKPKRIYTKGNVEVQNIKIGDIHYEYEYGVGMKLQVITLPENINGNQWAWQAKRISDGEIINYLVTEGMGHYSSNLYDYEAYQVKTMI